jgi:hypothetical protein
MAAPSPQRQAALPEGEQDLPGASNAQHTSPVEEAMQDMVLTAEQPGAEPGQWGQARLSL